jgi:hypothetical protein
MKQERHMQVTKAAGVSVDEVIEFYWRFLSRNANLAVHFEQFKKRYQSDQKAAEAEAIVFSLLRAEKLSPEIFEDPGTGGPDFRCNPSPGGSFLLEVTSPDSDSASKKSGLPLKMTGAGGGAYGLITEKLLSAAKNKAAQLGGHNLPGVLAITSNYDFAGLLLDRMAAEYLMTSAPQINVPLNGKPSYTTVDLRHAVFCRLSELVTASEEPIIFPCRQSISAILLITIHPRESGVVGLLHPEPACSFNPNCLPKVPYLKFKQWPMVKKAETEWILGDTELGAAIFEHRKIQ